MLKQPSFHSSSLTTRLKLPKMLPHVISRIVYCLKCDRQLTYSISRWTRQPMVLLWNLETSLAGQVNSMTGWQSATIKCLPISRQMGFPLTITKYQLEMPDRNFLSWIKVLVLTRQTILSSSLSQFKLVSPVSIAIELLSSYVTLNWRSLVRSHLVFTLEIIHCIFR